MRWLLLLGVMAAASLAEVPKEEKPQEVELVYTEEGKEYRPAPSIDPSLLTDLKEQPAWRQRVVAEALKVREESVWPKYLFGSADPDKGGFDCSGATYYLLRRAGYDPARTSSGQFLWLQEHGKIHRVPATTESLDDAAFAALLPGDLVFWSGTYEPTDGRTVPVTHVGIYLGALEGYHRPVMICASKGRYYDGKRRDGFGIYDFKLPSQKSRSKLIAYGSLPRIDIAEKPAHKETPNP